MLTCGKISPFSSRRPSGKATISEPSNSLRRHALHCGSRPRGSLHQASGVPVLLLKRSIRRTTRLDEAYFRHRAELDFVDYHNLNGAHVPGTPKEIKESHEEGFTELDEDIKDLDDAATKKGPWKHLSGLRSLMAYVTNRQEMGRRGEGLFLVTVLALALVLFPPICVHGCLVLVGYLCVGYGVVSAIAGIVGIGSSFSPFPVPRDGASFVTRGIFRFVRHPFYAGLLLVALGISIVSGNEFRLLMTAVLYWIFEQTIKGEEKDLEAAYPEYVAYKAKVSKLIPFLF